MDTGDEGYCKLLQSCVLFMLLESWYLYNGNILHFQVLPEKRSLKLLKNQSINVNWYMYCPESSVILLSTTVLGNVLQPFYFKVKGCVPRFLSFWVLVFFFFRLLLHSNILLLFLYFFQEVHVYIFTWQ